MPPRRTTGGAAVRRASEADAGDVARLLHDFQIEFSEPTPEASVLSERYEELLHRGEMIVLLVGDGPDGFAHLEELYVIPSRRGRGLGGALLEGAIQASRDEGATHMELGTSEDDVAARALYERAGFTNREGGPNGPMMLFYEREL
jgi:ribosomal protein S18 acetylase RimI-like enzyme